jgi:hypothetical protein
VFATEVPLSSRGGRGRAEVAAWDECAPR